MGPADSATPRTSPTDRLPFGLLHPPVRDGRFWVVQAGILIWAIVHDVVLVILDVDQLAGIPSPTTSALLLIPVMYAALNFGVRGGIGTALWATVLVIPHWYLTPEFSATHTSIEIGYLLVLNAVAVVVGQRVEREQRARQNAEESLTAAREAEARYYTLFENQPAPVLITDLAGMVVEANTAAKRLLGMSATGSEVSELLGVDVESLLHWDSLPHRRRFPLAITRLDGSAVLLMPTAHRLDSAARAAMVQIVLSDITEQHRRQEEQRVFARRMLHAQEDERRRIARELHDDPLQHLTYLTRTLDDLGQRPCRSDELVARLSHTATVADDAATSLRKIIQGLRPPVLDDLGLVSALRQLTDEIRTRTDARIILDVTGRAARLSQELELTAYRITQEALSNVIRHARAEQATVALSFADTRVSVTVTDDGRGIGSMDEVGGPAHRLGLIGMRERVNMAGGTLELSSVRPHGTRVHATIPLHAASDPPP